MAVKQGAIVAIVVALVGGGGLAVAFFNRVSEMGDRYHEGVGMECGPKTHVSAPHPTCDRIYVPIKSLGYKPGSNTNKNNLCIGQGFVGHDSAKPNGHCFKYKSCPHPDNGVAEWETCRHRSFGQVPWIEKFWFWWENL